MTDVCVIGGGPAGIFAAFFAKTEGNSVTVIDRNEELLKKLLLTGNGKCNYSNSLLGSEFYNFGQDHPYSEIIEEFDSNRLEDFFMERGMPTFIRDGYKYPRSERADTVKDVLTEMLDEKNVKIISGKKVVSVEKACSKKTDEDKDVKVYNDKDAAFFVLSLDDNEKVECRKLIIATGGKAYPSTGSDGGGYRLARELGHTVSFTYPVLTRLFTEDENVKENAGVRLKAGVSAAAAGETLCYEEGELQFTKEGLSGICIFNISRFLSKPLEDGRDCSVIVDFLPEMSIEELSEFLKKQNLKDNNSKKILGKIFGEKTAALINKRLKAEGKNGDVLQTAETLKHFKIGISGHDTFNNAQVTRGGVSTDEVDSNMASKICPGLFFAGEVLDVDGKCGGYNLHWAFASGRRAGMSAGKTE